MTPTKQAVEAIAARNEHGFRRPPSRSKFASGKCLFRQQTKLTRIDQQNLLASLHLCLQKLRRRKFAEFTFSLLALQSKTRLLAEPKMNFAKSQAKKRTLCCKRNHYFHASSQQLQHKFRRLAKASCFSRPLCLRPFLSHCCLAVEFGSLLFFAASLFCWSVCCVCCVIKARRSVCANRSALCSCNARRCNRSKHAMRKPSLGETFEPIVARANFCLASLNSGQVAFVLL